MEYLHFTGQLPERFDAAIRELSTDLGFAAGDTGAEVRAVRGDHLAVVSDGASVTVTWAEPVQLYRALSLIPRPLAPCDIHERAAFRSSGVMFDCSRNAVLTPETLRMFLRKMALMGLNLGMMYTEDTYEVPEQPYFGYKRGRYTFDELKAVDDYADLFGIELCPCIQTLGHLDRVMHWPAYYGFRENEAILEPDREETYEAIAQFLRAASAPYRSKRIHLGMDEAWGLGFGAHYVHHGYENPNHIMGRHVRRVLDIAQELGLSPMMWSDMYFAIDGRNYHSPEGPSPEAIAAVDPNVSLVYWDYYQDQEERYLDAIRSHRKFPADVVFAGGLWTWVGPAPAYGQAVRNTVAGLSACRKERISTVIATCWGDDGQECSLLTALPGMQLYGELTYREEYDEKEVARRFRRCCGGDWEAFLSLSEMNILPGLPQHHNNPSNACKIYLYQDPLVQLFEKDLEDLDGESHFAALAPKYARYARENPAYGKLFDFYAALAHAISLKCRWHAGAAQAVRTGDREAAAALAEDIPATVDAVEALRKVWRDLWEEVNKPYGFEVIDFRMGGLEARLNTAGERMAAFARGQIADIPELSEKTLPYHRHEDGTLDCTNVMRDLLTAARLDHPY